MNQDTYLHSSDDLNSKYLSLIVYNKYKYGESRHVRLIPYFNNDNSDIQYIRILSIMPNMSFFLII